jgi:hypothetical protein
MLGITCNYAIASFFSMMHQVFSSAAPQVTQANRDVHVEMDTLQSIILHEISTMPFLQYRQPSVFLSWFINTKPRQSASFSDLYKEANCERLG